MSSITLSAPAKVNLILKVLSKRKDGYHDIFTVFERIDLADRITISKARKGISIHSDKPITKRPQDDLMYKAALLILRETGLESGVRIDIAKNIPIAAGLGGGSSDAAAVLSGINALYGLKLPPGRLFAMGGKLGADVVFFLSGTAFAIGTGSGADIRALPVGRRLWHLIVFPGFGMPTKEVYEYYDKYVMGKSGRRPRPGSVFYHAPLTNRCAGAKIVRLLKKTRNLDDLERMLYNDLEDVSVSRNSGIGTVLERLAVSLGRKAIVSGSGPSVFCLYGTKKEASRAREKLLGALPDDIGKVWQVFVVGAV